MCIFKSFVKSILLIYRDKAQIVYSAIYMYSCMFSVYENGVACERSISFDELTVRKLYLLTL